MSEVTLFAYGGSEAIGGEYIVFYQDGKAQQEYFKSHTLPGQERLESLWKNGQKVDFIARGSSDWCTVTRKCDTAEEKNHDQQLGVVEHKDFDKLESKFKEHWSKGRVITHLVFGDNNWVFLSEKGTAEQQLVIGDKGFPEAEISKNWDSGSFIKTSTFGEGKYALVFQKGDVPQSLYMDSAFPEEEIEDLWSDCYSVSGLIYGDGKWVLISNEQNRNNHQGWVSDTIFPDEDLEELIGSGGLQPKLPPATQVQGVSKTGWLQKMAPAKWKPWKRRFFVLSAKKRTCYYYSDVMDERPKGYFFINGCTVGTCEDASIEKKHPNTFQVAHPIRRTFYVQAPDERTRDEWIREIQSLLDEDFDRKKTEIEKFQDDLLATEKEIEWGLFIARMREILETIPAEDDDNMHFIVHKLGANSDNANVVTADQLALFVSAFGFAEDCFDKLKAIAPAWHGILSKSAAEAKLAGASNGTYMVWLDSDMSKVVISALDGKGKVEHRTVTWDYSADQFFVEEDVFSHDLPVVFRSIESCIQNNGEWTSPLASDMASFKDSFESHRQEWVKKEAAMRKAAEEAARAKAEEEAAAAAAAKADKGGKKSKKDKAGKEKGKEKGKKGRGTGKKKGAKAGDEEDAGGEKKKKGKSSKGKKSKK
mmetsp:Transcript_2/g.11  ORF Transcript_2/g.11 Transcript_2/m.11 type:complete len:648 (-) Transcript_2:29-1972(-)